MLTFALGTIAANHPDRSRTSASSAQPGDGRRHERRDDLDARGHLHPQTTERRTLDAAKDFLAFIASVEGTEAQTAAVAPSGRTSIKGATLPGRRRCRRCKDIQAYIDAGRGCPGTRVPVAHQGPVARADHGRGRLRPQHRRGWRRAVRPGRGEAGQAAGPSRLVSRPRGPASTLIDGVGRTAGPVDHLRRSHATRRPTRARAVLPRARSGASYPYWFYLPAVDHLRRHLHRCRRCWRSGFSLTRWTLFDAEFIGLDNFAPVLARAGAGQRRAQHARLRGRDQRSQGRHRAAAGDAADLVDAVPQPPALAHLLPGARQHGRGRHHVRGPDASVARASSTRRSRRSASTARRGSPTRASRCCRSRSSTSGRASASPSSSSSPASCRSRRSTSTRSASRVAPGRASGTSSCPLEPERDVHGHPAVVHRRPADVRPHLDDDPRRARASRRTSSRRRSTSSTRPASTASSTAGNVILFIGVMLHRLSR